MDARPFIVGAAALVILAAMVLLIVVIRRVVTSGRSDHPIVGTRILDAYVAPVAPPSAHPEVEPTERIGATLAPQPAPGADAPAPAVNAAETSAAAETAAATETSAAVEVFSSSALAEPSSAQLSREDDTEPAFEPVAPVELWFGESRVGVRPGTPTFAEFQRLAALLLRELKQARQT